MDVRSEYELPFTLSAIRAVAVRVSREFGSSPEQIFDAWLDPGVREAFLPSVFDGDPIEPRLLYIEIDRPHRLTFSLEPGDRVQLQDHVTVELAALEHGTLLVLIHETSVHRAADTARIKAAWSAGLDQLAAMRGSMPNPGR